MGDSVHYAASGSVPVLDVASAADKLDRCEYRKEGSPALWGEMRAQGLVAVFGASDDLMEFRGAIHDEIGAYDGTTAYVTQDGLFTPCERDCKHSKSAQRKAAKIDAMWCPEEGLSWAYHTAIPHKTFMVMEDGEPYCRGIVFSLDVLTPTAGDGAGGEVNK